MRKGGYCEAYSEEGEPGFVRLNKILASDLKYWLRVKDSRTSRHTAFKTSRLHIQSASEMPVNLQTTLYSTETAVAVVFSEIARTVNAGQRCTMIRSDLSAAFDSVDHFERGALHATKS